MTTYISYKFKNNKNFSFHKPLMFNIINFKINTILNKNFLKKRQMNLMCQGTILTKHQAKAMTKIVYLKNSMLKSDPTIKGFINFCITAAPLDYKVFQHVLETYYPRRLYNYDDLVIFFPNIKVSCGSIIDNSFLITILQTSQLKNQTICKQVKLTALATTHKEITEKKTVEYLQTGQKNPDVLFTYNEQSNSWERYFDFKSGNFNSVKGHIHVTSNFDLYENLCQYVITQQAKMFKDYPLIKLHIKSLLDDSLLSWSTRNQKLQSFYFHNMIKFPDINPTLVFFNEDLTSHIYGINRYKKYEFIVTTKSCINPETTENALALCLYEGGSLVVENYKKQPYVNSSIVKIFSRITAETTETILNWTKI